jgi:hypothetical protein
MAEHFCYFIAITGEKGFYCFLVLKGSFFNLMIFLCLPLRSAASQAKMVGGTNPFPTTCVRLCLWILSSCLQEPLVVGARGLSSWG